MDGRGRRPKDEYGRHGDGVDFVFGTNGVVGVVCCEAERREGEFVTSTKNS